MFTELKYPVTINPDALISELITSWINGNKNDVLHQLKTDHAGLVAAMIVQGSQDRSLTKNDCNEIANRLMDDRYEFAMDAWAKSDSESKPKMYRY